MRISDGKEHDGFIKKKISPELGILQSDGEYLVASLVPREQYLTGTRSLSALREAMTSGRVDSAMKNLAAAAAIARQLFIYRGQEKGTVQSGFVVLHLLICLHGCLPFLVVLVLVLFAHQTLERQHVLIHCVRSMHLNGRTELFSFLNLDSLHNFLPHHVCTGLVLVQPGGFILGQFLAPVAYGRPAAAGLLGWVDQTFAVCGPGAGRVKDLSRLHPSDFAVGQQVPDKVLTLRTQRSSKKGLGRTRRDKYQMCYQVMDGQHAVARLHQAVFEKHPQGDAPPGEQGASA